MTTWITESPDPAGWRQRILDRVKVDDNGCWIWQLAPNPRSGYGTFKWRVDGAERGTSAHRAAWLAFRGPIPYPLVPDHLCRVRACCNPEHLEIVTQAENLRRSVGKRSACGKHGCANGYWRAMPAGYTRWVCRTCVAEQSRRLRARRREEAPAG